MTLQQFSAQGARRTPKRQWQPAVPKLIIVAVTVLASFVSGTTAANPCIMGGKPAALIEKVVDCTGRDTIPFYTVEQQANTLAFLAEFPYTIAALSKTWVCRNFCEWDGVHCSAEGVEVRLDSRQVVGRLPEVPTAVDAEQVMVTHFAVEGEGDGIKGGLPESWRKLGQLKSLEISLDYSSPASKSFEVQNNVYTVRTMIGTASRKELNRCFIPRNAENVSLNSNRMSGTLPPNLPICNPKMKYLYLHNNTGLQGTIPKEWGSWTSLQIINIELTNLCGCPPKEWDTFNPSVIVLAADRITDPDLCKISCKDSSSSSPELECDGPVPFYTPSQQMHTRNFLEAFKYTITDLQPLWTCTNFCVWEYVHCTPAGVALEITGTQFFGSVPEVPADVNPSEVVVTKLDFSHSKWVEGDYPSSWALLTSLENVSFAYTSMWGTLPSRWSSMSALKYLDFSFTWTGGRFPESWSRLANLEVLRLVHLTIPDHLPASWSSMSALQELDLDSTGASGTLPPSWGALTNLEILSLSNNNLDATLPGEWSSLTQLRTLHLHDNQLSGTIPETYNAMITLTRVSLEVNRFCGCLPSTWADKNGVSMMITAQPELLASDCATENACKPETESSSSAPSASSSSASSSSSSAPSASSSSAPSSSSSAPSASSSSAPSSSSSAPSASSSSAPSSSSSSAPSASSSSAPSSSSSLECYGEIPYYSVSEVENTRLFLMSVRESFPALIPLWVCPNFCSWPGIYCAPAGVVMDLSEMQLQGSLPSIGEMCDPSEVVLRVVDFGGAEMSVEVSGTLPENWSGLTRLERLDLSYTGVSGTLPPAWSALSSLEYLNLGYNDLFGTLPYSWGLFPSLREIYLNDNSLSGGIPSSWMHLAGFEVLDLTNNQLEGSLPSLIVSSQRTFGATATEPRLQWKRRS